MADNIAMYSDLGQKLFLRKNGDKRKCIFLSHKKEDEDIAVAIGEYLTTVANVNIYLDINDCILSEAINTENDKKIVESIKRGLQLSTHILCIISDKTKLSWWVPYEIGSAEQLGLEITSLKMKTVEELPSFLKIYPVLENVDGFLKYLSEVKSMLTTFKTEEYSELKSRDHKVLYTYLKGE